MNQLEDTMKCGPKDSLGDESLKKCVGEQRNYQSKIEIISVLSFGKAPNIAQSLLPVITNPLPLPCPPSLIKAYRSPMLEGVHVARRAAFAFNPAISFCPRCRDSFSATGFIIAK